MNPNWALIVRNIRFLQIDTSIRALSKLVGKLEQTCKKIEELEEEGALNYEFEIIHDKFNLSSAQHTCNKKGKKLIELQTSDQLLVLLQKLNGKYTTSPAGTLFLQNSSNFVFASNGYPFKFGSVDTAIFGNKLQHKYDKFMYKNYYLRYMFNGTKAFYEITPLSATHEQIICMYRKVAEEHSLASSCKKDLLTLKNTWWTLDSTIKSYTNAISRLAPFSENNTRRNTRGLVAGLAVGAAVGGAAAGVLPTLFSNYMSIQELKDSSVRTETILGQLDLRTNLLDVNQNKLNSAIQEASKIIKLGALNDDIQSVKIHANSISIFVEKRIDLLRQLTGTPKSTRSYLLSMSLPEIKQVITHSFPSVRPSEIKDPNILYSFQVIEGGELFLILKVLIQNELKIQYFVKSLLWPRISNNTLTAVSHRSSEWFILLSQEKYIESTQEFVNECRRYADKCNTELIPKTIISGRVPPPIAQYFKIEEDVVPNIKLNLKLFLVTVGGNYLAYTSIFPVEIRITCINKKTLVSNLTGRGLLHITNGCKVSSPYFTILSPKQLGSLKYHSIPTVGNTYFGDIHVWNTSSLDFSVTLKPITKLETKFGSGRNTHFYLPIYFILVLVVIGTMGCTVLCCYTFFVFNRHIQSRPIETHV